MSNPPFISSSGSVLATFDGIVEIELTIGDAPLFLCFWGEIGGVWTAGINCSWWISGDFVRAEVNCFCSEDDDGNDGNCSWIISGDGSRLNWSWIVVDSSTAFWNSVDAFSSSPNILSVPRSSARVSFRTSSLAILIEL